MSDNNARRGVRTIAAAIKSGATSAREVAEETLAYADKVDADLNTLVWRDDAETLRSADEIDRARAAGEALPAFAGVPLTIKDTFAVKGQPHVRGSNAFEDTPAQQSDLLVESAFDAGFVQVGRSAVPELAMTTSCENERTGITRNPWNPQYSPGGSSGGSAAAVAAGIVPVALSSDGGGSIRVPAAYCGVVGLKPSRSLLPQEVPGWEGGAVEGFVTRDIRDTAAVLTTLAKPDPYAWNRVVHEHDYLESIASRPERLRVGLLTQAFDARIPVDAEVRAAAEDAASMLAAQGYEVTEITPTDAMAEVMDIYPRTIIPAWLTLSEFDHPERLQAYIQRTVQRGTELSATEYLRDAALFKILAREINRSLFRDYDVIVTPTSATRVPQIGVVWEELREQAPSRDSAVYEQTLAFTTVPSVIGAAAISLPTHVDSAGLPIGVQLIGPQFSEPLLLQLGALLEDTTGWLERRPIHS